MFKLLALISVLTSTALAQSSATTNSTSSSSTNPLIPTGISDSCQTFLNEFSSDSTLSSCLSTLTNVTSAFAPGSPNPSSSDVSSTLTNLCSNSVAGVCPESAVRQDLANFYVACSAELTGAVSSVREIYEVLYILLPFRTAVCSKDDSGNWCSSGPSKSAREIDEDSDKSLGLSEIMSLLFIKKDNGALPRRDQAAIVPNLTAIQDTNAQYSFFTPQLSASQLCVTCVRQILTAYINFESNAPFAYGLNQSELLGTQSALYNAVQNICPQGFLSGAVEAAGGLSGSSAISTYGAEYQRTLALVMGAVTLVVAVVL